MLCCKPSQSLTPLVGIGREDEAGFLPSERGTAIGVFGYDAHPFIGGPHSPLCLKQWRTNGSFSALYVEPRLAPTLQAGDVIILDNLSSHESPKGADAMRSVGAWFLFLPPCSPDLNPVEMTFSKLRALIRRAATRTSDDLWRGVGNVCDLFTEHECNNFFKAAGYEIHRTQPVLAA